MLLKNQDFKNKEVNGALFRVIENHGHTLEIFLFDPTDEKKHRTTFLQKTGQLFTHHS